MTSPTLRQGARGIAVVALQIRLNQKIPPGGRRIKADSHFGPLTQTAVITFQRSKGLSPDGVVGPLTWAALDRDLAPIVSVDHGRRLIAQPTQMTCWAASTAMINRSTVPQVIAATPQDMIGPNGGLGNGSAGDRGIELGQQFGRVHGLRVIPPASWTTGAMVNYLRRSPLIVNMLWDSQNYAGGRGSPGHWVLVNSVVSDGNANGGQTVLRVLDPWAPNIGEDKWHDYTDWVREVPTRTYRMFSKA